MATIATMATSCAASTSRYEKKNFKHDASTASTLNRSTASIIMERSTLPHLPFSINGLKGKQNGLEFLLFLFAELFSQHSGLYAEVSMRVRSMRRELVNLTNDPVSPTSRIYRAGITSDGIHVSFKALKYCYGQLLQKVDARLEGYSFPFMDSKRNISVVDHGLSSSKLACRSSSDTRLMARSGFLTFPNPPFSAVTPLPTIVEYVLVRQ